LGAGTDATMDAPPGKDSATGDVNATATDSGEVMPDALAESSADAMCSNNPKYLLEQFTMMDAGACPCAASECCFSGLVCLPL
jgi:hypothetical protein